MNKELLLLLLLLMMMMAWVAILRRPRGLPSMTSALEGGEGGSQKVDKSTDKLRDHVNPGTEIRT